MSASEHLITTVDELEALYGTPSGPAVAKEVDRLTMGYRAMIEAAPFAVIATVGPEGVDCSPKGDPAGFTLVLDDRTIAIPERPGNRRADGFRNILSNPHVGLLYLIPGRGDTLRINGRARLLSDADFFDRMVVKGHRPKVAVLVEIEEVFHHCSKAFLRSALWKPESWHPEAMASRALISQTLERKDESLEALEAYYGPSYAEKIYR